MSFVLTPFVVALSASAVVSATVAAVAWGRLRFPGRVWFAAMMSAVAFWSAGSALEAAAVGEAAKWLFSKLAYIGTVSAAPLFLLFAIHYGLRDVRVRPGTFAALWLIPVLVLAAAFTNQHHELLWTGMRPGPLPGSNLVLYGHGIVFWVMTGYNLLTVLAGTILLARSVLRIGTAGRAQAGLPQPERWLPRPYTVQSAIILAAVAAPWIGFAMYVWPRNPFPGLELSVIFFALTGVLLLGGIWRFRLFDLIPVAWRSLVEHMSDAVLVVDRQDRILDLNPAARRLLGVGPSAVGQPVAQALASRPEIRDTLSQPAVVEVQTEIVWKDPKPRYIELRVSALRDRRGERAGQFAVLREVTDRKQAEAERERLIAELRQALRDIKNLRGLLPICASCKKIRDDQGYWQSLEQYVTEHSEAQFTHGLCPECMKSLYPEFRDVEPGEPEPG